MKIYKKSILIILLALAGQQTYALDWSWFTRGMQRVYAPISRHYGKILVGLGIAGAAPFFYRTYKHMQLKQELQRTEIDILNEQQINEQQKKIRSIQEERADLKGLHNLIPLIKERTINMIKIKFFSPDERILQAYLKICHQNTIDEQIKFIYSCINKIDNAPEYGGNAFFTILLKDMTQSLLKKLTAHTTNFMNQFSRIPPKQQGLSPHTSPTKLTSDERYMLCKEIYPTFNIMVSEAKKEIEQKTANILGIFKNNKIALQQIKKCQGDTEKISLIVPFPQLREHCRNWREQMAIMHAVCSLANTTQNQ